MKKRILSLVLVCASFYSSAQTVVFEKNQEKARYNQTQNVSQMIPSTFYSSNISPAQFSELTAVMNEKDGYVSCTLTEANKLEIVHENWIPAKDIIDVLKGVSITVLSEIPIEKHTEILEH